MTRNESSCERVLITGVTGMIGANVAAVLLRQPQAPLGGVEGRSPPRTNSGGGRGSPPP